MDLVILVDFGLRNSKVDSFNESDGIMDCSILLLKFKEIE